MAAGTGSALAAVGCAGLLVGRRQAAAGGATLYAPGAPFRFTYPPFAALLFSACAGARADAMNIALTAGSLVALTVLCGQALAAAGIRRRPEIVFAVSALALQIWPVAYTLHLGEVNLILAALIGTDLLRPRDGAWWQGIGTGLAAGIKLTPLIFVAYLALTGRLRAAAVAAGTFAVTVAAGLAAARPVPDVLARRGVLRPEPDRRPGPISTGTTISSPAPTSAASTRTSRSSITLTTCR